MQLISTNLITQGQHGSYNAVDIGPRPDPYYYAPENGTVTLVDDVDNDTCGKRLKVKGATGEHGFCHNATIYVKLGQKVKRGQKLAKMGYTGYTVPDNIPAGTHVHWILNINGVWVYPPSRVNQSFIKLGGAVNNTKPVSYYRANQISHAVLLRGMSLAEFNKYHKGKTEKALFEAFRKSKEHANKEEFVKDNYKET